MTAYIFGYDSSFSTRHDFKVAKIAANELLKNYPNGSLMELEQNKYAVSNPRSSERRDYSEPLRTTVQKRIRKLSQNSIAVSTSASV